MAYTFFGGSFFWRLPKNRFFKKPAGGYFFNAVDWSNYRFVLTIKKRHGKKERNG